MVRKGGDEMTQYNVREDRMNFLKGLSIMLVAILLTWCMAYGAIRIGIDVYRYFNPSEELQETMFTRPGQPGKPGLISPTHNFSDTNRTLKGIERQLERMNDIQLKIHQEGR
jgi:hypothetical protein